MKTNRVLMGVTAILIVILFIGVAMHPATSYNQTLMNTEANSTIESNMVIHGSNPVLDNGSISHINMKLQEAHVKSINIEFNQKEAILNFEFEEWLNFRGHKFIHKKLNNSNDLKLIDEFLHSNPQAQYIFNKLVRYQQISNKINMGIVLNSIQNSNYVNLTN